MATPLGERKLRIQNLLCKSVQGNVLTASSVLLGEGIGTADNGATALKDAAKKNFP